MWFPTVEQIEAIHDRIIERGGGSPGRLQRGPIEAAIERARWGPFREEDLAERAAFLMRGIAQDHPFVDGNKRTAFEAADTFLGRNGYTFRATEEEIVSTMVDIARGRRSLAQIASWIREHMEKG